MEVSNVNPKKTKKLTHKDVEPEWRDAVKRRAVQQEVDENEVIRFGLHYDFKAKAEEKAEKTELKALQKEVRDIQKENEKTLKSILKELEKKK